MSKDTFLSSVLNSFLFLYQSPTSGWFQRPKALFLKGATVTAALMTPPVAACTFTVATKLFLPTSTAWWTTFTATTWTPAPGKKQRTLGPGLKNLNKPSQCASTYVCRLCWRWQVHLKGKQLPTVPPLSRPAQRHPARLRWQHAQWHFPQQRRQVFLCWLHGLRHWWDDKSFSYFYLFCKMTSFGEKKSFQLPYNSGWNVQTRIRNVNYFYKV